MYVIEYSPIVERSMRYNHDKLGSLYPREIFGRQAHGITAPAVQHYSEENYRVQRAVNCGEPRTVQHPESVWLPVGDCGHENFMATHLDYNSLLSPLLLLEQN